LKAVREKKITYKDKTIKITDFSTETLKARGHVVRHFGH
jgi:hypothetical protein